MHIPVIWAYRRLDAHWPNIQYKLSDSSRCLHWRLIRGFHIWEESYFCLMCRLFDECNISLDSSIYFLFWDMTDLDFKGYEENLAAEFSQNKSVISFSQATRSRRLLIYSRPNDAHPRSPNSPGRMPCNVPDTSHTILIIKMNGC